MFIYCARFNTAFRRYDLLEGLIRSLDDKKYGFIIIGDGEQKPSFRCYRNVHDFGAVYDNNVKRELFSIADAYYQGAWMGLSVVEAMAYGKPVFTYKRSKDVLQGVEYGYISSGENGMLFDNLGDCVNTIKRLTKEQLRDLGCNAKNTIRSKATIENMVANAYELLEKIYDYPQSG